MIDASHHYAQKNSSNSWENDYPTLIKEIDLYTLHYIVGSILLCILMAFYKLVSSGYFPGLLSTDNPTGPSSGYLLLVGSEILQLCLALYVMVMWCLVIRNCWAALPREYRDGITPNQGAWFCIIPVFGFYWLFVGYAGLASNLNRFALKTNLLANPGAALATFCCFWFIFMVFAEIIFWSSNLTVGIIPQVIDTIIWIISLVAVKNCAISVLEYRCKENQSV